MMYSSIRSARLFSATLATAIVATMAACGSDDNTNTAPLVATTVTINTGSNGQSGTVGQALALPISVHVVDQDGNAFSGATIAWTVLSNGGTVPAATSTTNATGDATAVWTLGNAPGADSLRADLGNGSSVIITATATVGSLTSLTKVSGDAQTVAGGSVAQPFVVKAVDGGGNALANIAVAWVATGAGTLSASTATTDATGVAQVTLTTVAGPGTYTVSATSGTAAAVTFTVTGT
ncbi:MAG: Ig-like domain-containing protein [bacterium]